MGKMYSRTRAAGGKRRRKSPPATTELPEDVIRNEILTRLPIKPLVRFKCVSKSWLSLFSDSQFVKDHRTRGTTQNPDHYDCLVAMKDDGIYILSHYQETSLLNVSFKHYELIGSINGLLCLRHRYSVNLLLWNPAIHQAKELALPVRDFHDLTRIGFGFDPVSNDYKVVVCCLCDGKRYAFFYSFNYGSWNDLFIPDSMYPTHTVQNLVGPSTIVKGCPYWKYGEYSSNKKFKYVYGVKFDVRSNQFKMLPKFRSRVKNNDFRGKRRFRFVNMKDNFSLMVYEQKSSNLKVDVYTLDEEEGSWIRSTKYSIRVRKTGPTDFVVQRLTQGFEYCGELVFHECGKFFCYDQKTDTIKHILGKRSVFCIIRCYRYTPSLEFLQGMKSVQSKTVTSMFGH